MFDVDDFVQRCAAARPEGPGAVRAVVEATVADASAVTAAMEGRLGVDVLHRSDDLTVLSVVVPPGRRTLAHDHRMWAVVGVYSGQEDNHFYRRSGATLAESGGRSLRVGDALTMGDDAIHAIENPTSHEALGALHVYGGDLVGAAAERSMWTMPDFVEAPYDDVAVVGRALG